MQARYRKHFSPRWSLQAQAKYNHGWNQYKDEGKEYADGYYRENHRQDEYYISATVLYRPLEALTLSLAQDGVINKLRNSLPECPFLQDILPSVPSMHATDKDGSRPRLRWCILPLRSMPRKVRSPMTSIALPPLYQSVCSLGRTSRCISG